MNIAKSLNIEGVQAYTMTTGDIIKVVAKNQEEFKFKVPDNFQGTITITIKGNLQEIVPT
jgi:hypothetical protein